MNTKEHLLVCLAEECAEVQQAVAKALRFGLDDGYPGTDRTNEGDLLREINDLAAIIDLLAEEIGLAQPSSVGARAIVTKKERVREFMEYARQRGTLVDEMRVRQP